MTAICAKKLLFLSIFKKLMQDISPFQDYVAHLRQNHDFVIRSEIRVEAPLVTSSNINSLNDGQFSFTAIDLNLVRKIQTY